RTLESLYVNPILEVLRRQNPKSKFVDGETKNGVFDTNPWQTLYLFIDMKTPGEETWDAVYKSLDPLRRAGYLTTVKDNSTLTRGPVTVIGTGNTPLDRVASSAERDIFFDGPVGRLAESDITNMISPIASGSLRLAVGQVNANATAATNEGNPFSEKQLGRLRKQIAEAKERGIGVRYWDTPEWPVRVRNAVWRVLVDEGVALLNTDDLDGLKEYF
ncbi:Altered inheritance of mitochondria protein 6, partial [Ascosphaera aggregata]